MEDLDDISKTIKKQYREREISAEREAQKIGIYELDEIVTLSHTFNENIERMQTFGPSVNLVTLFDSISTIKALCDFSLLKYPELNTQLRSIAKKTRKNMNDLAKVTTLEQANSSLLDYYNGISNLNFFSQTMIEIGQEVNKYYKQDAGSTSDKMLQLADDLKLQAENMVNKTKSVIGEIGQRLKAAVSSFSSALVSFVKNKIVPDLQKAFKWLTEKFDDFKLWFFKSLFNFIAKLTELAATNDWKVKDIAVGMIKFGMSSINLVGLTIPIPTITEPPAWLRFIPTPAQSSSPQYSQLNT